MGSEIDNELLEFIMKSRGKSEIFKKSIGKGGMQTIYDVPANEITRDDLSNLNNMQANINNFARTAGDPRSLDKVMELIKKEKIITLQELENYIYGGSLIKTLTSTDTDVLNNIYGKRAWDQVNREHTLFSLLRKGVWSRSGWRVITPETTNDPQYTVEDGSIPASEEPTVKKLKVDPSSIARRLTQSDILNMLARIEDGIDEMDLLVWLDQRHKQIINSQLLAVNENAHNSIGLWSIDRLLASYAEYNYGDIANSAPITGGYLTVYGQARSSASWLDAQVSGQAYTLADRALSISLMNNVLQQIRTNGGRYSPSDKVILTHPETANHLDELCANNQRYNDVLGSTFIRGGRGGMENLGAIPRDGIEGGFQVATWKGIPIFTDPGVVQDSIGRIYIIDLRYLFMSVLVPTRYYAWGGPETTAAFNMERMYRTVMNTVCRHFRSSGKIRDLQAP